MYQELLQQAGLSLNESRVYEALLHLGEVNVNALSIKSKVHRRNVYDSLNKLIEKGLASETFVKGEKLFKPVDPQRLIEIIKEKESALTKFIPEMTKLYHAVEPEAQAYFFRGVEGFKNYLQLILEQKQTVHFIGAKAFWLDPRLQHYLRHFDNERKKLGIQFMHLFDYEIKEQKPDIVLLDIIMPRKNGFEVLKSLKKDKATAAIPVIVLTNLGQQKDLDQAKKLGAADYLVKVDMQVGDIVGKVKNFFKNYKL